MKRIEIKEGNQVVVKEQALAAWTAPNEFLRKLADEAEEAGEATATDFEGCEVTAIVWDDDYAPDFDDVAEGLAPGIYPAKKLNSPSGADCEYLLVRQSGSLGWCYEDGSQSEDLQGNVSCFSVEDLCAPVD